VNDGRVRLLLVHLDQATGALRIGRRLPRRGRCDARRESRPDILAARCLGAGGATRFGVLAAVAGAIAGLTRFPERSPRHEHAHHPLHRRVQRHPRKFDAFEDAARAMTKGTQPEPGTLVYDWYLSRDRQRARLIEAYVDADAMVAHLKGHVVTKLCRGCWNRRS